MSRVERGVVPIGTRLAAVPKRFVKKPISQSHNRLDDIGVQWDLEMLTERPNALFVRGFLWKGKHTEIRCQPMAAIKHLVGICELFPLPWVQGRT